MKTLDSFKKSKVYVVYVVIASSDLPYQFHFCKGKDLGAVVAKLRYGISCGTITNDTVKVFDATDKITSVYAIKSTTKHVAYAYEDKMNDILAELLFGESYDLDECIATYNFKPFYVSVLWEKKFHIYKIIKSRHGFPVAFLDKEYEHIFTSRRISDMKECSLFSRMKTWANDKTFYMYPISEEAVKFIESNFKSEEV